MSAPRAVVLVLLASGCGSVEVTTDAAPAADATSDGGAAPDARPIDAMAGVKRVFVTSVRYPGDLGAVAGADLKCNSLANQVGLAGNFLAWLSDGTATGTPAARFVRSPGPYALVDGTIVATSWTDLTDGALITPIDLDERGFPAVGGNSCFGNDVWSAIRADGTLGVPNVCGAGGSAWISAASTNTGGMGTIIAADDRWSYSNGCVGSCSVPAALYCFEQ